MAEMLKFPKEENGRKGKKRSKETEKIGKKEGEKGFEIGSVSRERRGNCVRKIQNV